MSNTVNADNVVQVACQDAGCKCVPIASKGLPVSIKLAIDKIAEIIWQINSMQKIKQ